MRQYFANITPVFPDPVLYTPDFGYMDKMLQRKQAQYDKGFAQLSSVWQQISRATTNPENTKKRDEFLKQAKENLKNLSTMDLSDFRNVQSAMKVFEPYANNTELIADQDLTQHWDQQESIADSYRNQDGGKYFSEYNLNDIRKQRQQFASAKASDWKNFYNNKRFYTPYIDTANEVMDVMKNFKPGSVSTMKVNGMYLTTITDKSWYKEDIQKFLDSNLSQKAKEQWAIEARVMLTDDPERVKNLYLQSSKSRIPAIDKELSQIQIKMNQALTADQKKMLQSNKEYFQQLKSNLNENISALEKGDPNFLSQKLETFARSVYIDEKVNDASNAYSHPDIAQKVEPNDVAVEIFKQKQMNYRARLAEDEAMKRLKMQLKAKEDDEVPPVIVNPTLTEEEAKEQKESIEKAKNEINTEERKVNVLHEQLKVKVANEKGISPREVKTADFEQYLSKHSQDQDVKDYRYAGMNLESLKNISGEGLYKHEDAVNYTKREMGSNFDLYQRYANELKKMKGSQVADSDPLRNPMIRGDMPSNFPVSKSMLAGARIGAEEAAARKVGISVSKARELREDYDTYYNAYMKKEADTIVPPSGLSYSKGTSGFKGRSSQAASVIGVNTEDVDALTVTPRPDGTFSLSVRTKAMGTKDWDDKLHQKYVNAIKSKFPNAKVSPYESGNFMNKQARPDIRITGLTSSNLTEFRDDDIYSYAHSAHASSIEFLSNWRGKMPGVSRTQVFEFTSRDGKDYIFPIRKTTGMDVEYDEFEILNPFDQKKPLPIRKNMKNIVAPYKVIADLLYNNPSDVIDQRLYELSVEK